MPEYVYRCRKCGHTFTEHQRITDPPLTECVYIDSDGPCVDGKVYRVVQPIGIAFKGTGFHSTDYGSSGARKPGYQDYAKAAKDGSI